jgi:transposase InsO family protein
VVLSRKRGVAVYRLSARRKKHEVFTSAERMSHKRLTQARIAAALGVSCSTVGRVLARAGLSRLSDLQPAEPVVRYEHEAPGQMLHIDTKKLGRIERPSHRVTGNRRDSVDGAGWETLFVAIDDHARIAFTDVHPNEKTPQAVLFVHNAVAYYRSLGVSIERLLTDNGSAFRSKEFAKRASSWAPAIASRSHTGRRPMARLSASSNRRYESGPTALPIRTPASAHRRWSTGTITTTGTAHTMASEALPP